MTRIQAALHRVAGDLDRVAVAWALVGGLAVSVRAEPRFTRDVDLAVAVADDSHAEAVVRGLAADGYRPVAAVEQDAVGRLATVRLSPPDDGESGLTVDLLFASSGIEPEIAAAGTPLEVLPGLVVPVARSGHLIALKLLARDDRTRPQDAVDLRALVDVADAAERQLAADGVALIIGRGVPPRSRPARCARRPPRRLSLVGRSGQLSQRGGPSARLAAGRLVAASLRSPRFARPQGGGVPPPSWVVLPGGVRRRGR